MSNALYILVFLVGGLGTVSSIASAELSTMTTLHFSLLVNHLVNLTLTSIILLLGRKNTFLNPPRRKAPIVLYFTGLLAVVHLSLNFLVVKNAGVTVAMVGIVFGQSLFGFIFDSLGLLGLSKRKITRTRLTSLLVSFLGLVIMMFGKDVNALYFLLAILCGSLIMLQQICSTRLSSSIGIYHATRANVLAGTVALTIGSIFIFPEKITYGLKLLPEIPLFYLLAAGMIATFSSGVSNFVIPRLSASATVLIIAVGQNLTALVSDYILYDKFSTLKLVGVIFMIIGQAIGARERKSSPKGAEDKE